MDVDGWMNGSTSFLCVRVRVIDTMGAGNMYFPNKDDYSYRCTSMLMGTYTRVGIYFQLRVHAICGNDP